jgi:DNA-binding CsgD family transcriptional regulator
LPKHLTQPPPRPPELSEAVWVVVERALAKSPEARYAHVGDLAQELVNAIFGLEARPRGVDGPPLAGLLDTLSLLADQARAYERAGASNYAARAAVTKLGELARQALNEAGDLAAALQPALPANPVAHPFSPRELEVLTLAAQGLTNKEIAYRLGLSERTVQFHLNSVFNKSGTNSRTEAVAVALRQNWLAAA